MQTIWAVLESTWEMALAAAPWLVVGLVVAALIKVYVPSAWLTRFLRGRWGVVKAALIGAPLPLCSCGVIPAALAIRRQGASRGSTMSFLVATPETGVDSVALSYALLGPFLAVVRPVSAVFSAIVTGLIGAAIPEAAEAGSPAVSSGDLNTSTRTAGKPASAGGCCSGGVKPEPAPAPVSSCCSSSIPKTSCCETEAEPKTSCCSSKTDAPTQRKPGLFAALIDAAAEILGDTMKWLLIGLLLAGVIGTFFEQDSLAGLGTGLPVMLLMVVVGIPMYICATASTPFAAGLLLAGLSPGAVLVFMLAGPATNVATLGVVRKELGTRYMVAYLVGVSASAIICGLATDLIAGSLGIVAASQAQHAHEHEMIPQWLAIACLVTLVVLAIKPLRVRLVPLSPQAA